ncbi:hypothetical protein DH2020_023045 [Rehmannia glutinosa]|uniref:Cyclic nucleotide-binding domain-containing protein n=1 Tax=Rehmannia glutinosa TaxID=99300 RepID=A0ABR0W4X1_REHGL
MGGIRRGVDRGSERIKSFRNWSLHGHLQSNRPKSSKKKTILDPQEPFLERWNKIFVLSCVIAVSLDPLFFYIPVVDGKNLCLSLDENLEIIACVLRSGELIEDPKAIAKRDTCPRISSSMFYQFFPYRRIYPLYEEVTRTSGIFTETAWAGAAFNLILYMLASHVLGSIWYLIAIERKDRCWRRACRDHNGCNLNDLSLGQNLKTSTFVGEILFAVFISVIGLVLFSLLIGNMQKYLQSITVRVEEMRVKRRDAEQWMSHRMLPEDLRTRIRRYEQYKWQENRGVEEDSLIHNLPKDLRRDIKRHLCWTLLTRVPMFEKMDEQLLDAMCSHLKPVLYTKNSFIVREGDPVDEMLFIMRGNILTMTTNGGRTGFFNSVYLMAGDFCGEELLTWALDPNSSSSLPISTRTVQAVKDVEAFCLMPDDLKFVASQFRRLHSKQLRHIFRCSSPQWRTWGACFIQAAWRRHCRRKIEKSSKRQKIN